MSTANSTSKGGLIAATVISIIVAVAMLIWAIVSYVAQDTARKSAEALNRSYLEIAPNTAASSIAQLRDARTRAGNQALPLLDFAVSQRDQLKTALAGSVGSDTEAKAAFEAAVAAAKDVAGPTLQEGSAVDTITSLSQKLAEANAKAAELQKQLAAAQAQVQQTIEATDGQLAQSRAATAKATETAQAVSAQAQASLAEKDGVVAAAQQATVEATQAGEESVRTFNTQIAQLQRRIQVAERDRDTARNALARLRVPVDQVLRQADGKVVRTPDSDRVIINLGSGQGIAPGLTFEVFDPLGVPRVVSDDASEDALLKGKASIEVVRVQPGSSEARIIRATPGVSIREGDLIVNLVYDQNVKYNFVVFGKFNLDRRGEPSTRDGEALKRLVTQWGGVVSDNISISTDFLVLGDEPVIPAFSQTDLQDPIKARQFEDASRELEAYNDIRSKAQSFSVPILNQTRFLYLVGYYEESQR